MIRERDLRMIREAYHMLLHPQYYPNFPNSQYNYYVQVVQIINFENLEIEMQYNELRVKKSECHIRFL